MYFNSVHAVLPQCYVHSGMSNTQTWSGGDTIRHKRLCCSGTVYDFSFAGGEFDCKTFLEKYTDRFLGDVDPHEIARRLEIKKVISQNLCSKLLEARKPTAVGILYIHMRDHGSLETVCTLCDVMIGRDGLPNMNKLGQDMKQDLPVSCVWCNMYMYI